MSTAIREARRGDQDGILSVVGDAFSYGGTRDAAEELDDRPAHLGGTRGWPPH